MLSSFLFTARQQRLLAILLLRPDQEFNFASLQHEMSGGVGSLYHYLRKLVQAGVVTATPIRRSVMYRANTKHPLCPELRNIAVKSFAVTEPIRDALLPYAKEIERGFIFGSIVKGAEGFESDVDVMVVVRNLRKGVILSALAPVKKLTGREIHANVYGAEEWPAACKDPIIAAILQGPTIELHFLPESDGAIPGGAAGIGRSIFQAVADPPREWSSPFGLSSKDWKNGSNFWSSYARWPTKSDPTSLGKCRHEFPC